MVHELKKWLLGLVRGEWVVIKYWVLLIFEFHLKEAIKKQIVFRKKVKIIKNKKGKKETKEIALKTQ